MLLATRFLSAAKAAGAAASKAAPKAKAAAAAKPAKPAGSATRGAALLVPLRPSQQLADVIGSSAPVARGEAIKRVWEYIHKHKLQSVDNKREINCDAKLGRVFGTNKVTITGILGGVSKHLAK